jgi:hypothetical protein
MYRLRWGSYTWIPALVGTAIIGFIALFLSTRVMGEAWYGTYYVPMLGYFVMVSVCQAHYFKSNPEPNLAGIWRQGVSIVGAIALFYFHRWVMGSVFGIPAKLVLPGQLTFILVGFFVFAWDDSMARGQFAKWIRIDALKALFWYAVIWVLWYLVFAMPGGLVSALGTFNQLHMNMFLAIFQWMIILQLMMGIIWKDILQGLRFPNNYVRGVSLLVANATVGVALSYITYLIGSAMAAGITPSLTGAEKWRFVLMAATYPLIPVIVFGLYTNQFGHIASVGKRVAAKTALVFSLMIVGYLLFRFVVSRSGIFGHHPWWNDIDLVYNFTIPILLLTHFWFSGRLGFLVGVKEDAPAGSAT